MRSPLPRRRVLQTVLGTLAVSSAVVGRKNRKAVVLILLQEEVFRLEGAIRLDGSLRQDPENDRLTR